MPWPSAIVATAASAAPEDTPMSAGSANGLRNMPCIMAPAIARLAPTNIASSVRGKRISISTSCSRAALASTAWPNAAAIARGREPMLIPVGPTASEANAVNANSTPKLINTEGALKRRELVSCTDVCGTRVPLT